MGQVPKSPSSLIPIKYSGYQNDKISWNPPNQDLFLGAIYDPKWGFWPLCDPVCIRGINFIRFHSNRVTLRLSLTEISLISAMHRLQQAQSLHCTLTPIQLKPAIIRKSVFGHMNNKIKAFKTQELGKSEMIRNGLHKHTKKTYF